jgi:hypothetical protein
MEACSMAETFQRDLIKNLGITVGEMLPAGYFAEAKFLVDRVAAVPIIRKLSGLIEPLGTVIDRAGDIRYLDYVNYLDLPISEWSVPISRLKEKWLIRQHVVSTEEILLVGPGRELADLPSSVVNGVVVIAESLAEVEEYRAAVSIGLLADTLDTRKQRVAESFFDRLQNYGLAYTTSAKKLGDIADELYSRRQYAACAALLAGTTRMTGMRNQDYPDVWRAVHQILPRRFTPASTEDGGQQQSKLSFRERVPMASEERHINAWVEDADVPLIKGQTYRFALNIGKLRANALSSPKLGNIDWGQNDSLTLVVLLSGSDFKVEPRYREIVLPKYGDTGSIFFYITPLKSTSATLRISLHLARELTLLEEFEIPIPIMEGARAA